MRWRVFIGLSLVANLLLALGWFWSARADRTKLPAAPGTSNQVTTTNLRTAVIVRRQFFSWQELESQDYPTYIKNLREIGCPDQTIRDIIIADVTEMLRDKRMGQAQKYKPNPKWWTNLRDAAADGGEANQASKMWAERGAILEQLLGPGWAIRAKNEPAQTNAYQNQIIATMDTNPLLQGLAADKKQLVVNLLQQAHTQPERAMANSGEATQASAAEKDCWARIGEILSPEQLEAAKLHFSLHAEQLRSELDALPGLDTQPEEFRKIFRSTEAIEAKLLDLADRNDEEAQKERATLTGARDAAIRAALTPARYEMYVRLGDPAYLSALEKITDGKGDPASLGLLYAINRESTAEQERIQNDTSLTDTQREIELKRLELEQLKATAQALGEKLLDEPGQKDAPPKPEPQKVHRVATGESLDRIARIYGVDPNALRAANPGLNFEKLEPGAHVNVPLRLMYPLPPSP